MPYERPGAGVYATATKVTPHNGPCTERGLVGVAVKQKALSATAGLITSPTIAIGERFHIRTKGEKQVRNTGLEAAGLGDGVYINETTNALALAAAAGRIPFGRVSGLPGDAQGCPVGFLRIDLDQKGTL